MNLQYRSNIAFILAVGFFLWANACLAQPANIRITNNGSPQNEPMVAINPQNHDRLVAGFNDERTGNYRVGWAWSNDGGAVWNFGATFNPGGTTNPGIYSRGADPVVAFDSNGTGYMAWLAYNPHPNPNFLGRDGSIFIARSGDGGQTFNVFQKRIAQGNGTLTYYDKPWLYVNPANNHVYVAWTKRTNAWGDGGVQSMAIEFVRSTDGGATFSNPVQVSTFNPATGNSASHGPQIAAGPGNSVYVAWHTLDNGDLGDANWQPPRIWIAQSNDGGQNFGANQLVATKQNSYPNRFISLGVDRTSGRLYVAYADRPAYPGDYDVYVATAAAAAGPWASTRVNDDAVGNGRWQYWPSLDVAPNGRVDVIWYDQRDNANLLNVYYSYTEDGGASWAANSKLTDNNGFNPVGNTFAGDYSTIASVDEKAYAVWMDNRLGNQEIYGANIVHAPAVVLLFDTSGSMEWSHSGAMGVPTDQQRLTLAKRAAIPFMQMIEDHFLGQVYFGITAFPPHPWNSGVGCVGAVLTPMTVADANNVNAATSQQPPGTIQNLSAEGNTPLLGGMTAALGVFGTQPKQAILLLSDGYHNCPSTVSPTDASVTNLIAQITNQGARVYTVGFGRPTDVDHPLLEAFANQTNGSFYDVTVAGFDAANWDPQTALQATYKSILVTWLGLDPIADPFGTIQAGQQDSHQVPITSHSRKVSFFLSWASAAAGRLGLRVLASDGQPVTQGGTTMGVRVHEGETHVLITVDEAFLDQPGKLDGTPWTLEIDAENLDAEQVKYQYSVFSTSALKMSPQVRAQAFTTGANLTIKAAITEGGQPVTGLSDVKVRIGRPLDGQGNWFAEHHVTETELQKIPAQIGTETLSLRQRKARYLFEQRKVDLPGRLDLGYLQLFDDGTHGDADKNDGIYTNTFSDTSKEGSYIFHFRATGTSLTGSAFMREAELQHYLLPIFSPDQSQIEFVDIAADAGLQRVRVIVTPKDSLDNHLGPGRGGAIHFSVDHGKAIGALTDNLDGTYSQIMEVPISVASGAQLNVTLGDRTKTVHWPAAATPEDLFNWLTWILLVLLFLLILHLLSTRRP